MVLVLFPQNWTNHFRFIVHFDIERKLVQQKVEDIWMIPVKMTLFTVFEVDVYLQGFTTERAKRRNSFVR